MYWLSDVVLFPAFQILLVLGFIFILLRDALLQRPGVVTRGSESMRRFGVAVAFIITILTLLNGTALKEGFWLKDYSVAFNLLDVGIVMYLGFYSPTCRNWMRGRFNRAAVEN